MLLHVCSGTFPQSVSVIESRMREMGYHRFEDSSVEVMDHDYQALMEDLYLLLHSESGLRYFKSVFQKAAGHRLKTGKGLDDYLSELWIDVCSRYEYEKGHLLPFLTSRLRCKIMDDARKNGGLTGIPRRSAREMGSVQIELLPVLCAVSGYNNVSFRTNVANQASYDLFNLGDHFDESHERLFMEERLLALAAEISAFMKERPASSRYRKRMLYYQVFYSSDIIACFKKIPAQLSLKTENTIIKMLLLDYLNFCFDRTPPFTCASAITAEVLSQRPLAKYEDVIPLERLHKTKVGKRIETPIPNEVIRGYMELCTGQTTSSSNISQMRKRYTTEMYERLHKKGIDYAAIIM